MFIDDRVDMFPMSVIETYRDLRDPELVDRFGTILDDVDPTAVVWQVDTPLGAWFEDGQPGWVVVHRTDEWLVVVPS